MFMSGTVDATLRQVQLVDIHGTHFYDIIYSHDDEPEQPRRARVGSESIYKEARAGDAVRITYLMNMPVEIAQRK